MSIIMIWWLVLRSEDSGQVGRWVGQFGFRVRLLW